MSSVLNAFQGGAFFVGIAGPVQIPQEGEEDYYMTVDPHSANAAN